jgi:spore maturation protein CgeB
VKLVIFGLSISSAWGNGHATLWRGLLHALVRRGHFPVFFEHDVPYYAQNRDLWEIPGGQLILYSQWKDVLAAAARQVADADVAMVTSYCPHGVEATNLVLDSKALKVFYDLDTPVTLDAIAKGHPVPYLGPSGLAGFDTVLSYAGGAALDALRDVLSARHVVPLYGSVDPVVHHPAPASDAYRAHLSYLGTYAADRQDRLEALFIEPARRLPHSRFILAGSQYPPDFPLTPNIYYLSHVRPPDHASFYCSAGLNLNVTRGVMANMGYCPSGRLFEVAACGAPILTDSWPGLDEFFEPGREILVASNTAEAMEHLATSPEKLKAIGAAARRRALDQHTADHRAEFLESVLASSRPEVCK